MNQMEGDAIESNGAETSRSKIEEAGPEEAGRKVTTVEASKYPVGTLSYMLILDS